MDRAGPARGAVTPGLHTIQRASNKTGQIASSACSEPDGASAPYDILERTGAAEIRENVDALLAAGTGQDAGPRKSALPCRAAVD